MGEDEADTARAVRERREAAQPIVANLGGRIVKTTGDGACLGFPRLSQRSNTRSRSRSDHQTLDMNSPSSPKVRLSPSSPTFSRSCPRESPH